MENVYTSDGVPGRYWHALADGRIQCDLCPRECKLHEGQRGLCSDWKMRDVLSTPPSTLKRAREIALRTGLRYVYTGNVHDEAGQSTYCHACAARLIGRDCYTITAWDLDIGGRCAACGETCLGLFEALPGSWGARREPVVIAAA
jgi:pyruvate formate lyase activating enzyme